MYTIHKHIIYTCIHVCYVYRIYYIINFLLFIKPQQCQSTTQQQCQSHYMRQFDSLSVSYYQYSNDMTAR